MLSQNLLHWHRPNNLKSRSTYSKKWTHNLHKVSFRRLSDSFRTTAVDSRSAAGRAQRSAGNWIKPSQMNYWRCGFCSGANNMSLYIRGTCCLLCCDRVWLQHFWLSNGCRVLLQWNQHNTGDGFLKSFIVDNEMKNLQVWQKDAVVYFYLHFKWWWCKIIIRSFIMFMKNFMWRKGLMEAAVYDIKSERRVWVLLKMKVQSVSAS